MPARAADEEDVALSAFKSFCFALEGGRYPNLFDRDGLWAMLVTITARKVLDLKKYEHRQRRRAEAGADDTPGPENLIGREPDPEVVARVAEECQRLLDLLTDPVLRTIALRKIEGYTNAEIAAELGIVCRSVERKLNLIRRLWKASAEE